MLISSQFAESYVCYLLGATQTDHSHRVDGLLDGYRIEVKHAVAFDNEVASGIGRRLHFKYLQGGNKNGKEADVYVMVGYDEGELFFFAIPSPILEGRAHLDIYLYYATGQRSEKWWAYRVPQQHLKAAVLAAAREPTSYRGWRRPDLFSVPPENELD